MTKVFAKSSTWQISSMIIYIFRPYFTNLERVSNAKILFGNVKSWVVKTRSNFVVVQVREPAQERAWSERRNEIAEMLKTRKPKNEN